MAQIGKWRKKNEIHQSSFPRKRLFRQNAIGKTASVLQLQAQNEARQVRYRRAFYLIFSVLYSVVQDVEKGEEE